MDITNKTKKPLNVPLPGGKKLFLAPGKTGQISPKALEHPPLAKLIEAGDIATATGPGRDPDRSANAGAAFGPRSGGAKLPRRQYGDR